MSINECKLIAEAMQDKYSNMFESKEPIIIEDVTLYCPHCNEKIDMDVLSYHVDDNDWTHTNCTVSPTEGILLESQ